MSTQIAGDWDMTSYFPELGGAVYRSFRQELERDMAALLDELATGDDPLVPDSVVRWSDRLCRLEDIATRASHLSGYLGCLGAADSRNEAVASETASAAAAAVALEKCHALVEHVLGRAEEQTFARLLDAPELRDARYFVARIRRSAAFRMDRELELLASELSVDGFSAWGRLYDRVSGGLEFDLCVPGRAPERRPVAHTRSLLESPDPEVRCAALSGANAAWERVGDVVAACLNGIGGTRHTLYRRRGVAHFLDPALFDAGIERATLDTLLETVERRSDLARRYLARKASLLDRERLGFQDLRAPLPARWTSGAPAGPDWAAACRQVTEAFDGFLPALGSFAREAIERRWIDHCPRPGKRPGGFCSTSSRIGESRIFMTYNDTLGDVFTLAHELGHAFHGRVMRDQRHWARRYPMTLAETASTFAEQIVADAVLDDPAASTAARATLLDSRLQDAATFLLDIPMRFHFEHAFYEERAHGEVPVGRLKELMTAAQRRCFGDALAEDELDPWFWASKLHFYITGTSFYNFPYTFGYLFSLGLFARAREEGPDFLERYDALLRRTGSDTAENVAAEALGVDLRQPTFWNASIDQIERDLDRFESTLGTEGGGGRS